MHISPRRRLPPWLVGLIIALVVFAAVLLIARLLGLGDDPVVEGASGLAAIGR